MRVVHLISSGGLYGAESMLLNLIPAQLRMGLDASLLAFENRRNPHIEVVQEARRRNIPAETLSCQGRFDRNAIREIADLIENRGIDVLHSHGYKSNFYGYAACARANTPFIATCHLWTRANAMVRLYEAIDAYVLRRADHVVGVSDAIADALLKAGISPTRASVIYNGINKAPNSSSERKLRTELEIVGDAPLVGSVARLEKQKGLEYFIEAAQRVLLVIPEAVFVIVGEGSARESLAGLIRRKGLAHRIRLLGRRDDISNIYASLDLFVLPSLNEGLPMVLLEALSASLPVVATRVGAVPKVIESGHSGLLVDPANSNELADGILACLRYKRFADSLGIHGRATVLERFSSETMSRQYLEVYERLLRNAALPRLDSLMEV